MVDAYQKCLELRIPADMRYISVVRRGVRNLAESAGFDRSDIADVEVAVSEAVTNSVKHGSPHPDIDSVLVKCSASSNRFEVEIEDSSMADAIPACPPSCEATQESGRGVLMMHRLMDECEGSRTDQGIKVKMAKQKS